MGLQIWTFALPQLLAGCETALYEVALLVLWYGSLPFILKAQVDSQTGTSHFFSPHFPINCGSAECCCEAFFLWKKCGLMKNSVCGYEDMPLRSNIYFKSCGLLKKDAIAAMEIWTNLLFKSSGYAITEGLTSSCGVVIADLKNMRVPTSDNNGCTGKFFVCLQISSLQIDILNRKIFDSLNSAKYRQVSKAVSPQNRTQIRKNEAKRTQICHFRKILKYISI